MNTKFVQIGVTAARDPATGAFMPSIPIYSEVTEEQERAEASATKDISKLFAAKMKAYIDGGGSIADGRKGG